MHPSSTIQKSLTPSPHKIHFFFVCKNVLNGKMKTINHFQNFGTMDALVIHVFEMFKANLLNLFYFLLKPIWNMFSLAKVYHL
jgi:hypothetical protein